MTHTVVPLLISSIMPGRSPAKLVYISQPHIEADAIKDEENAPDPHIFCLVFQPRPASRTMSENSTSRGHPGVTPTYTSPPQRGTKVEPLAMSRDRQASTSRQPRELEKKEGRRGDATATEETERSRRGNTPMIGEMGKPRGTRMVAGVMGRFRSDEKYKDEVRRLRGEGEKLKEEGKRKDDQIANLKRENVEIRGSMQKFTEAHARQTREMEVQARQARAMEEKLKKTEQLLEARTAELSVAQTFLSTADRLSEVEVLSIVRELNENIFQVAVSLAEGWEKLRSSGATGRKNADPTSQPRPYVLLQLTRNQDSMGLTCLLQSYLCEQAVNMIPSWDYNQGFVVLRRVYEHLSASGEHHIINTKWCVTYAPQRGKRSRPDGGR